LVNEIVNSDDNFKCAFEINGLKYFPFIYENDGNWYQENVIGPCDCEDGYFYVKNIETGEIRKLFNVKIDFFDTSNNNVYFAYNNSLFECAIDGSGILNLYECEKINPYTICCKDETIYFYDSGKIKIFDINSKKIIYETSAENIIKIMPINEKEFFYKVGDIVYLHNILFNTTIEFNGDTDSYYLMENMSLSYETINLSDPNLVDVVSKYPVGNSYFTKNENACHHAVGSLSSNCICYGFGYQCRAYASYATEKYSHTPVNTSSSSHLHYYSSSTIPIVFDTECQVISFFSSIPPGSFIRLSNDSSWGHSIFFYKISNTRIYTYECNVHYVTEN